MNSIHGGVGTSVPIGAPPGEISTPAPGVGQPGSPSAPPGNLTPLSHAGGAPQASSPGRSAVLPKSSEEEEVAQGIAKYVDQVMMQNYQKMSEKTKDAFKAIYEKDEDDDDYDEDDEPVM